MLAFGNLEGAKAMEQSKEELAATFGTLSNVLVSTLQLSLSKIEGVPELPIEEWNKLEDLISMWLVWNLRKW